MFPKAFEQHSPRIPRPQEVMTTDSIYRVLAYICSRDHINLFIHI